MPFKIYSDFSGSMVMNKSIENKKVLMFGPSFFGYCETIANELMSMGCQVDLYDERPNNSAFCKVMLRYNVKFYQPTVMKYYLSVIEENKDKDYDYVFVIKSEAINKSIFEKLKEAYPNAKFVLYMWDSVKNIPDGENKIKMYDRVLTFDPVDAEMFGIIFRPLFFRKEYEAEPNQKTYYSYDIAFIGTAHTIRPRIMKQLELQCAKRERACFSYLFLPHPIVYIYNKLLNPAYKNIRKKDIRFTSLTPLQIKEIYADSKCILDVEHSAQRGLTMRTIEMICSQKKLITTNKAIEKYDFYNKNNICIIDKDNPVVLEEFLESSYEVIDNLILKRYSLRFFVQEIFDIEE